MARPGSAPAPYWTARRVRASWGSVLLAIATIVAVVLVRDLVAAAAQPLGWVAAAAATALVLWPVVERLDQVLPRGLGIVVALVGTAALAVGLYLAVSSELRDQLASLQRSLPAAAQELEDRSGPDGVLVRLQFGSLVGDLVDQTAERVAPEPTVEDAAGTAPAFLVSGILVVFLLVWGRRMLAGGLRQIADDEARHEVASVAGRAAWLTQRYVLATVASSVVVGLGAGLLAWWAGLPTPLVLGVVVGTAAAIPYLGVVFGAVPVLLLAAPTEPAVVVVALAVALLLLQAAHTVVLGRLTRHGVLRAGPAVIVVCALVGSDVYGLGGALVAIVAGILAIAAIEAWNDEHLAAHAAIDPDADPAASPEPAPA